jgi:hypothetical protein
VLTDLGNYTAVATNSVGNVTSNVAAFLPTIPLVTIPPTNQTAIGGTTVTMNVTAVGLPTLTYQWQLNGVTLTDGGRLAGTSTTSLVITGVQGSDAGNYTVKVGNGNGNVTSPGAILQVSPVITKPPGNETLTVGGNARLTVTADGSGNVTYLWFFNGTAIVDGGRIAGNTTPTLNISGVQLTDAGNYSVRVTNALGNVTSIPALLTVLVPSLTRTGMDWREMEGQLNGVTVATGGNATNLYVAVGKIGTLLTSANGANWTLRPSGTTNELFGTAFGNFTNGSTKLYLAVGAAGLILQSADGVSWIPQTPATNSTLRGVIFANNEFVAFGDGGLAMLSQDGVTWTLGTTGTSGSVRGMAFLPALGEFVAVGDGGLFLTSVDGLSWSAGQTGTAANLNSVAFGNNRFVAVGNAGTIVTSSLNGSTGGNWQTAVSHTANNITGIVFDGVKFVGVTSSSETVISTDGVTWARGDTGHWTALTAVAYDSANTRYVTVGDIGINPLLTSYVLTSADGNTWTDHLSAETGGLKVVTHGLGLFVAAGGNESLVTSPDGMSWNVQQSTLRALNLNAIAFANGEFIAVGDGVTDLTNAAAYRSFDGQHWTQMSMPTTNSLNGVAMGPGNLWVAAGNASAEGNSTAGAVVLTSSNQGSSWNLSRMNFDNPILGLVYDNVAGQYVAIVGPSLSGKDPLYSVIISPDAQNWTVIGSTLVALNKIERLNGYNVVVGGDGEIAVVDPTAQEVSEPFTSTTNPFRDVAYGTDAAGTPTWVTVGDNTANDIDAMFTNTASDPATSSWNSLDPLAFGGLQAMDFSNGTFVAVGDGGRIFASKAWAPALAAPVANQGAFRGGNATFAVEPLPSEPAGYLSYQWQDFISGNWTNLANGAKYSGVTTPLMTIVNIATTDAVPYRVQVTGNGTTLISNNATILLGTAPVINQPPVDTGTVLLGSASFSVVATGSPAPTYRWRRNGVLLTDGTNVTGSNTSTLVLTSVGLSSSGTPNSAGTFSVDVTNIVGTVTASANLSVGSAPVFVTQPVSQNPAIGGSVVFNTSASGTPPPSYQWYLNGVAIVNNSRISGAATNTLSINPVVLTDLGNYTVVATNPIGNVTSSVATFLPTLPLVTVPPSNQTVVGGATTSMSVTAVGLPTLTYQWLVNGVAVQNGTRISGANTNSLVITNVQGADAGTYTVLVGNGNGNVTSPGAILQVSPAIATPPANSTVTVGDTAHLAVAGNGSGNVTYQWLFNGVAVLDDGRISGNTTPSLSITSVQTRDGGNYTVQVKNSLGNVTSLPATLTVLVPSFVPTGMDWREMEGELNAVTVATGGNATNLYVAVGKIGTLLTSADGANWTLRSTGTKAELFGTAFGNVSNGGNTTPIYLAVGNNGLMLESSDGVSWLPETPVTNSTLRGVIFANNVFVAFGDGGLVMLSLDGVTWLQGTTGTTGSVRGMTYFPALSEFVAVGDNGLFLTSVNGLAWTLGQTSVAVNLNAVAFGNGLFVAVGDNGNITTASFGASNGGNWQTRHSQTANNITGVIFDGTKFLGVTSSSETVESTDGVSWHRGDTGFWTELTALAYDSMNTRYVTVGDIGINTLGTSYILTSLDGNTWTEHASAGLQNLKAVTHGQGVIVAVGANETIDTSPDGALWTVHIRSLRPQTLNDVKYGAGEFMAVGDGVADSQSATAYRSFDGNTWSFMDLPTTNNLHGVAKGPGSQWVAVGGSAAEGNSTAGAVVLTTVSQGASWSINRMAFTNPFNGIVYDEVAGQYVAILGPATTDKTPADVIAISPDGLSWTFIFSTTQYQFSRIERANGYNVVVGTNGKMFVVNPAALSVTVPFTSTGNVLRDATYGADAAGNSTWVVVGDDTENDIDSMFTNTASNPATSSWNSLNPEAFSGLQGLDSGNGTFVAVGDGGRIFVSKPWAPAMSVPLVGQTGYLGGNTTFTVEPLPSQPAGYLTYQWQEFVNGAWANLTNGANTTLGANFTGVTTPLMTVTNVTLAQQVPFRVLLTGSNTTMVSNNATINLSAPAVITIPPAPVTLASTGLTANFTGAATGLPAPTYSWLRNGIPLTDGGNISGSNTTTLTITNAQYANNTIPNSAGVFTFVATNSLGTASASANLTINSIPVITQQPVSSSPTVGSNLTLTVAATAVPPPNYYQWYFNNQPVINGSGISGNNTTTLTINPYQQSNAGSYTVVVGNGVGNVSSAVASVGNVSLAYVNNPPLPASIAVIPSTTATITVAVVGTPAPSFQWYFNNKVLSNAGVYSGVTTATLSISPISATQAGNYSVHVSNGVTTLPPANTTVALLPKITTQPVSKTVTAQSLASFTVKATGTKLTYQWWFNSAPLKNGGFVTGATNPTLTITHAGAAYGGTYFVNVTTNPGGTVKSAVVTLTIKPQLN